MNALVIGDLHGRSVWEGIPNLFTYDRVVFIGDYFDAKENISEAEQIANFLRLLELKKSYPEKVTLLTGNHDYHYFPFSKSVFSGFSQTLYSSISKMMNEAYLEGILEAVCLINHFLITHAGVTKTWFRENIGNPEKLALEEVEESISVLWRNQPESFDFEKRPEAAPDGDDVFQPPFMVRPPSVLRDRIPNCIQVIGHTQVPSIKMLANNLIMCDVLGYRREALIIRDAKVTVMEF